MTHPLRPVPNDVSENTRKANFCSHCGQRLNTDNHADSAAKPPASDLDSLLQSTLAAKAKFVFSAGETGSEAQNVNVTLLGVSRTLLGVPRSDLLGSSGEASELPTPTPWADRRRQEKDLRQGTILIVSLVLAVVAAGLILLMFQSGML